MRLASLYVQNYKSIVDSGDIRIERFQAFVGENNAGKSNILHAIDVFLSPGAGGVQESHYYDKSIPIIITCTFTELNVVERKTLRMYLLGDKLILQKQITFQMEGRSNKAKPVAEYHGYLAQPKDWWLSIDAILDREGNRPNWAEIAEEHGLVAYATGLDGRINRQSYENGVRRYIEENEAIEFNEPKLGETQALGLQPVLLDKLPTFYLLPAITDYSNEIDRRSTTTVFRRLMGDLADRIIQTDKRYQEVLDSLHRFSRLFNPKSPAEVKDGIARLEILDTIEKTLQSNIAQLIPGIQSVQLRVDIEEPKDLFSRGVSLKIDDGVMTEVIEKGHGMQRCVIFGLLNTLIRSQRNQLFDLPPENQDIRPIILAIEEPELYIHPQLQRLIYRTLSEFSKTDQVIFSSHSPAFVDIGNYSCIGVVRKETVVVGTKVLQCTPGLLGAPDDRKGYKLLKSFGLEQNQMFFANRIILVEGEQDFIAIVAAGRKAGWFEYPEELGYSIVVAGCKDEIPKFQQLLNAFGFTYTVLLEKDSRDENDPQNALILKNVGGNLCVCLERRLEDIVNHVGHFGKTYDAMRYFEVDANITEQLEQLVRELFQLY